MVPMVREYKDKNATLFIDYATPVSSASRPVIYQWYTSDITSRSHDASYGIPLSIRS